MKNIKDIFEDNARCEDGQNEVSISKSELDKAAHDSDAFTDTETDKSGIQKRKMYCPVCYENFYTYENICPRCGCILEEALTEEETAEYIEMLMETRL